MTLRNADAIAKKININPSIITKACDYCKRETSHVFFITHNNGDRIRGFAE